MIDTEHVVQRFLKYVSFDTQSDEDNDAVCPSTPGQLVFAKALAEELKAIGLSDVTLMNTDISWPRRRPTGQKARSSASFLMSIPVPMHRGRTSSPSGSLIMTARMSSSTKQGASSFDEGFSGSPEIQRPGHPFTDGTTLLGADDKAGITAIVSAMEYLIQHPDITHGMIRIGFTPDEETGRSAALFDVKQFAADFAYTVDGGELGGLEYENFNAANPVITFHGRSVHTGDAKGKMVNALSIAAEWQQLLPAGEKPEYTEGHEGFFHVYKLNGDVETCTMHMLVRDHDRQRFERRKALLQQMADFFNEKYGDGTVVVTPYDVYYNMLEKIEDGHMDVVDLAKEAMEAVGVTPQVAPIRGGTDGAQLSFRGLPCPNLFTGGANFHGRYEYLPIPSLVKACETVIEIAKRAAKRP